MAVGRKTGGRTAGTPNKATLERERLALLALQEQARTKPVRKLAKDELEELIPAVKTAVVHFQKAALVDDANTGAPGQANYDAAKWADFKDWLELFAQLCYRTADFQSPKYRAIAVVANPADAKPAGMTITQQPRDAAERERQANQAYLRLVKG